MSICSIIFRCCLRVIIVNLHEPLFPALEVDTLTLGRVRYRINNGYSSESLVFSKHHPGQLEKISDQEASYNFVPPFFLSTQF